MLAHWMTIYNRVFSLSCLECNLYFIPEMTEVGLLLHKPTHSQTVHACNNSQWVGEASFKPLRKTSDSTHSSSFSSLTHRHGQGPIREDRVIENESPIILSYKQRERHQLNVRQQDEEDCKSELHSVSDLFSMWQESVWCWSVYGYHSCWVLWI